MTYYYSSPDINLPYFLVLSLVAARWTCIGAVEIFCRQPSLAPSASVTQRLADKMPQFVQWLYEHRAVLVAARPLHASQSTHTAA